MRKLMHVIEILICVSMAATALAQDSTTPARLSMAEVVIRNNTGLVLTEAFIDSAMHAVLEYPLLLRFKGDPRIKNSDVGTGGADEITNPFAGPHKTECATTDDCRLLIDIERMEYTSESKMDLPSLWMIGIVRYQISMVGIVQLRARLSRQGSSDDIAQVAIGACSGNASDLTREAALRTASRRAAFQLLTQLAFVANDRWNLRIDDRFRAMTPDQFFRVVDEGPQR